MPPFNDSYIVTDDHSNAYINKFLSKYTDLITDKERKDFSVFVDCEDVTGTLLATLAYGLSDDQRSFALYFNSALCTLRAVILFFTLDGKLVLGLSTAYNTDSDEEAEQVLVMLKTEFETDLGVITFGTHPGDAYD